MRSLTFDTVGCIDPGSCSRGRIHTGPDPSILLYFTPMIMTSSVFTALHHIFVPLSAASFGCYELQGMNRNNPLYRVLNMRKFTKERFSAPKERIIPYH